MTGPVRTIDEIALRPGGPQDWNDAEPVWQIEPRILNALGLTRGTDETRLAAIDEANRQKALINTYMREQRAIADEQAYRSRMSPIASQLATAIIKFTKTDGDEAALESDILDALRPFDERIKYLEMITGPNLLAGNHR